MDDKELWAVAQAFAQQKLDRALTDFRERPNSDAWNEMLVAMMIHQIMRHPFNEEVAKALRDEPIGRWTEVILTRFTGHDLKTTIKDYWGNIDDGIYMHLTGKRP